MAETTKSSTSRATLRGGETVLIIDRKGRRYLITLTEAGEFHTHAGVTPHSSIIGLDEGSTLKSDSGATYVILRPTLSDYVVKMKRGAQVIYPKDIGPIITMADIGPGMRVLEAGVGSAGLSLGMLRAGADIIGYEQREDFARIAEKNVEQFLGAEARSRYNVQIRDVYEGIDETDLDRIILDLPEPWQVVKHAEGALHNGGLILAYSPSITQVVQFRDALKESRFGLIQTNEYFERGWYLEGQAVRPDHRMVAHTGFLTVARLLVDSYTLKTEAIPHVNA